MRAANTGQISFSTIPTGRFPIAKFRGDGGDIGQLSAHFKAAAADYRLYRLFAGLRVAADGFGPDAGPGFFG